MSQARELNIEAVVDTARRLEERIGDRFNGRSISQLAAELVEVANETKARIDSLNQPRWIVRAAGAIVALLAVCVLLLAASRVRSNTDLRTTKDWLELLQAALQDIVFLGLGALFLQSLEGRIKRRGALAGLDELRSLAHVIDMHQLTKDPEAVLSGQLTAEHSPDRSSDRFELARYLEYCSEMLSLTNKLAALYAQKSQDSVVLGGVRDVQDLVGMLTAKIWQKLVIIDTVAVARSAEATDSK